jgi:hypothetical protein
MALTKNIRILLICVTAAVALSACAKKDNSIAARKNSAGARDINPTSSQQADQYAMSQNVNADIVSVNQPAGTNGGLQVTSRIVVNNYQYDVTTTHSNYSSPAVIPPQNLNGATFNITGVCGDQYCNPYYLVINISANGRDVKQMAMMKFFFYTGSGSQNDVFYSRLPGQFLSLQDAMSALQAGAQQVQQDTSSSSDGNWFSL